mmetsp:Transcript_47009/g.105690  ORF Transcript_47009/g.105690 Transcript_47009/m.105690 type:complete len:111 (+) Transcript_47009:56-388(+)|eukprot:CAMPEP_0197876146 /NCGR_PEP_ID=MMETSP1439-20131203/5198_1 /TAXON_ID=66791 /ORGANISM="Gonyaulax spinifera, Strain CCMP409" /LENGTH=110 /DNA_ID=CAMNT_0043495417 /DNA_START=51 /DNA_END=383 /DNA_ORIENTATION=-
MARPVLPALAVLALVAVAAVGLLGQAPGTFVAQPGPSRAAGLATEAARVQQAPAQAAALGAAAGLLAVQPAHAGILFDEIIPYASVTSFSVLWGIVLGFVLLRLQEAFPE